MNGMPSPAAGLAALSAVVAGGFVISIIIKFIFLLFDRIRKKEKSAEEKPTKIYYVTKTVTEKKKRARPKRKTDIAFKGIVISAENAEEIKDELKGQNCQKT